MYCLITNKPNCLPDISFTEEQDEAHIRFALSAARLMYDFDPIFLHTMIHSYSPDIDAHILPAVLSWTEKYGVPNNLFIPILYDWRKRNTKVSVITDSIYLAPVFDPDISVTYTTDKGLHSVSCISTAKR